MGVLQELGSLQRDVGSVLILLGLATILPLGVCVYYAEWQALFPMLSATVVFLALGGVCRLYPKAVRTPRNSLSIAATALVWIFVSFLGCLPFVMTGLSGLDALFESMSAWTGTGFTVVHNIEEWPKTILFWRSFMQWIGGLGIIAFMLTIASKSGLISRGMYRSEGHTEAFMPSIIATAMQMWKIYVLLTAVSVLAIMAAGLDLWDAVNVAFCAISTGGMSIYTDGISHFDNFTLEMVLVPIMLAGALPFRLYYLVYVHRSFREILTDRILHLMAAVFLFVAVFLTADLYLGGSSLTESFRHGVFMAGTAVSSTGFQNTSMEYWGAATLIFLGIFILVGGAAGSTAGGIKINRVQVLFEAMIWWFRKTVLTPRAVTLMRHDGKVLAGKDADMLVSRSLLLILLYILLMAGTLILILHDPYFTRDVAGTIYDVFSCAGNNGASAGMIGPFMPDYAKVLLFFVMWIGRLEIIPVIILVWGIFRKFELRPGK
jgi:trk system potassium uptake protein TrkH